MRVLSHIPIRVTCLSFANDICDRREKQRSDYSRSAASLFFFDDWRVSTLSCSAGRNTTLRFLSFWTSFHWWLWSLCALNSSLLLRSPWFSYSSSSPVPLPLPLLPPTLFLIPIPSHNWKNLSTNWKSLNVHTSSCSKRDSRAWLLSSEVDPREFVFLNNPLWIYLMVGCKQLHLYSLAQVWVHDRFLINSLFQL